MTKAELQRERDYLLARLADCAAVQEKFVGHEFGYPWEMCQECWSQWGMPEDIINPREKARDCPAVCPECGELVMFLERSSVETLNFTCMEPIL